RTLTIFGTPGYIAPEQAKRSAAKLTAAADIYSLGAILFELFTGRTPFLGEHALAVIQEASEKPAPKLRSLLPGFDSDLETICARCLDREPQARYASAGDLAKDLECWLEGRPILARPVSPPVRIWRWSKRNPKLAGSLAACLLAVAAAGAFQLQNRTAARAATAAMHSVAVDQFLDLDTAQPDSKLAAAVAKALQGELSKHGPAHVTLVSANETTTPNGDSDDEGAKSRWQGARAAIQGTKRVRDGNARISMRLLNAADGKVLYKKIIEADGPDHAPESVAKLTGAQLYTILNVRDLASAEVAETDPGWRNPSTRELLISGKALQERRTPLDMDRSAELFQRAVTQQPNSALAHSCLAVSQWGQAFLSGETKYLSNAAISTKRALELNPNLAEAHKAMSMVLFEQGRFSESLSEAFISLELADESDDFRLIGRLSSNLRMLGQPAKAAAWLRLGVKTSNRPAESFALGDCYTELGDDHRAAAEYNRAVSLFPELPEGWMGLCRLALLQRDFPKAQKIAFENWTKYRDHVFSEEMAAQVAFFSRDFAEAEKLYQQLAAKDPNGGGSFYGAVSYQSALGRLRFAARDEKAGKEVLHETLKKELISLRSAPNHPEILYRVAAIESSLGKVEPALEHLRAAKEAGWIDYRSTELDPRYDSIRSDPRFHRILDELAAKVARLKEQSAKVGL
ncbi:MAG: hypothetical protein J2P56_04105, partial [Verrucomicrobia bacterium]|nr:hypothetical protein [Verrucomicrobiota bacterium]